MVFKKKLNPDGTLDKFKARPCAKGYTQRDGIDYTRTFAPVIRYESVRTVIAISAIEQFEMCQFDIRTAFLYVKLNEAIYMEQPEGLHDGSKKVNKGLYGLKQSPRCWNETFNLFPKRLWTREIRCRSVYLHLKERNRQDHTRNLCG